MNFQQQFRTRMADALQEELAYTTPEQSKEMLGDLFGYTHEDFVQEVQAIIDWLRGTDLEKAIRVIGEMAQQRAGMVKDPAFNLAPVKEEGSVCCRDCFEPVGYVHRSWCPQAPADGSPLVVAAPLVVPVRDEDLE